MSVKILKHVNNKIELYNDESELMLALTFSTNIERDIFTLAAR
jgi:hypothetical protein